MLASDGIGSRRPAPGGSRIRKLILDKVRLLGPTEHHEIFQMLQSHGIAHSSNSNGVFINLSTVPDDVLATVKAFVDYCADNKKTLDEYDKRIQECKITHKFDRITSVSPCISTSAVSVQVIAPCREEAREPVPVPAPMPASGHVSVPLQENAPVSESVIDPVPALARVLGADPSTSHLVSGPVLTLVSAHVSHLNTTGVNALNNGRFQAAKKRFSRRKIIDRRHTTAEGLTSGGVLPLLLSGSTRAAASCAAASLDRTDSVLCPEEYTFA